MPDKLFVSRPLVGKNFHVPTFYVGIGEHRSALFAFLRFVFLVLGKLEGLQAENRKFSLVSLLLIAEVVDALRLSTLRFLLNTKQYIKRDQKVSCDRAAIMAIQETKCKRWNLS